MRLVYTPHIYTRSHLLYYTDRRCPTPAPTYCNNCANAFTHMVIYTAGCLFTRLHLVPRGLHHCRLRSIPAHHTHTTHLLLHFIATHVTFAYPHHCSQLHWTAFVPFSLPLDWCTLLRVGCWLWTLYLYPHTPLQHCLPFIIHAMLLHIPTHLPGILFITGYSCILQFHYTHYSTVTPFGSATHSLTGYILVLYLPLTHYSYVLFGFILPTVGLPVPILVFSYLGSSFITTHDICYRLVGRLTPSYLYLPQVIYTVTFPEVVLHYSHTLPAFTLPSPHVPADISCSYITFQPAMVPHYSGWTVNSCYVGPPLCPSCSYIHDLHITTTLYPFLPAYSSGSYIIYLHRFFIWVVTRWFYPIPPLYLGCRRYVPPSRIPVRLGSLYIFTVTPTFTYITLPSGLHCLYGCTLPQHTPLHPHVAYRSIRFTVRTFITPCVLLPYRLYARFPVADTHTVTPGYHTIAAPKWRGSWFTTVAHIRTVPTPRLYCAATYGHLPAFTALWSVRFLYRFGFTFPTWLRCHGHVPLHVPLRHTHLFPRLQVIYTRSHVPSGYFDLHTRIIYLLHPTFVVLVPLILVVTTFGPPPWFIWLWHMDLVPALDLPCSCCWFICYLGCICLDSIYIRYVALLLDYTVVFVFGHTHLYLPSSHCAHYPPLPHTLPAIALVVAPCHTLPAFGVPLLFAILDYICIYIWIVLRCCPWLFIHWITPRYPDCPSLDCCSSHYVFSYMYTHLPHTTTYPGHCPLPCYLLGSMVSCSGFWVVTHGFTIPLGFICSLGLHLHTHAHSYWMLLDYFLYRYSSLFTII